MIERLEDLRLAIEGLEIFEARNLDERELLERATVAFGGSSGVQATVGVLYENSFNSVPVHLQCGAACGAPRCPRCAVAGLAECDDIRELEELSLEPRLFREGQAAALAGRNVRLE